MLPETGVILARTSIKTTDLGKRKRRALRILTVVLQVYQPAARRAAARVLRKAVMPCEREAHMAVGTQTCVKAAGIDWKNQPAPKARSLSSCRLPVFCP